MTRRTRFAAVATGFFLTISATMFTAPPAGADPVQAQCNAAGSSGLPSAAVSADAEETKGAQTSMGPFPPPPTPGEITVSFDPSPCAPLEHLAWWYAYDDYGNPSGHCYSDATGGCTLDGNKIVLQERTCRTDQDVVHVYVVNAQGRSALTDTLPFPTRCLPFGP